MTRDTQEHEVESSDAQLRRAADVGNRAVVLIADDEPDMLRLVRFRLERCGWDVLVARDGQQALDRARSMQPDVCLLDVVMPKRTGFDVLEELRADSDTADMKVIMLTARTHDRDRARGAALGADDYITKPFSRFELESRVRAHLNSG